jgi:hypothetical protein
VQWPITRATIAGRPSSRGSTGSGRCGRPCIAVGEELRLELAGSRRRCRRDGSPAAGFRSRCRARTIFLTVSGYQAPPLTLGSSARMITSRPDTIPMPTMELADGRRRRHRPCWRRATTVRGMACRGRAASRCARAGASCPAWTSRSRSRCGRSRRARCWRGAQFGDDGFVVRGVGAELVGVDVEFGFDPAHCFSSLSRARR